MNINEIAKLAEVSRATVSRYLNDGYVSAEKRERIQQVIEQTGYKPSAQAQTLRTKKTRQVGVIISRLNSESISNMVSGVGNVLKEAGFQMLLANAEGHESEEVEYLKLFAENHVDGIVLIGTVFTAEHKRAMRALQVPIVILGEKLEGYSCVYQDDYNAAREATKMLLVNAKSIGYIGVTQKDWAVGSERKRGFLDVLKEQGIEWEESRYVECGFTPEEGYNGIVELRKRYPKMDTVFVATDTMALGVMAWAMEAGLRIPEDLALVSVGDTGNGKMMRPALSSVHFYYRTSGQEAAKILLELLEGKPAGKEVRMGYRTSPRGTTRQMSE
ncbi:MAG: LacI family DNA-binding transcriptional regulator [Lachnospiraceae bacterium]|nr:LacI family DNA-binding transcriptional regulator [Lachnospiraceae bacterium]